MLLRLCVHTLDKVRKNEMDYPTYLIHYGIEGQKWGVRRFQNEDGTYTQEGLERRYTKEGYKSLKKRL